MRLVLVLIALVTIAACAGPERSEPTAVPVAAEPPKATPTVATVIVVTTQERAVPPVGSERFVAIPTALPSPTRIPPTATPLPVAPPSGRTFPALFPPDLISRDDARWLPVPYRS